jgi:6-phosphogluconolactonase
MSSCTLRVAAVARPAPAHAAPARRPASQPRRSCAARASRSFVRHADAPAGDLAVHVYATPEAQAAALCALVTQAAAESIAARGAFALAIPGGSVLKMLAGLSTARGVDWSKVVLIYANHKAVEITADNSTHAKARALFLDACKGITVLAPSGGTDPVAEAKAYEAGLLALSGRLPFGANGVPVCDLMVLGGACPRNGYRGPSARPC